jgi:hypothetical protein
MKREEKESIVHVTNLTPGSECNPRYVQSKHGSIDDAQYSMSM